MGKTYVKGGLAHDLHFHDFREPAVPQIATFTGNSPKDVEDWAQMDCSGTAQAHRAFAKANSIPRVGRKPRLD